MLKPAHQHLLLIGFSTCLAAFSLAAIVLNTDPTTSGVITHTFFYASFFVTVAGLTALAGLLIRNKFFSGLYIIHLSDSLRQSLLLACLLTGSLLLLAKGLLFWWVELSLILLIVAIEALFNLKT